MLVGLRSRRGRVRIPIFCLLFSKSLPFPHKRGRNDCPICYGSEAQEIKGTEVYPHGLMLLKKNGNSNIPVVTTTHHSPALKGEGLGPQPH